MPYRDPLQQWKQSTYDPESPEAQASAQRAHEAQRSERLTVLEKLAAANDMRMFDHLFLQFFRDDPAILTLMTGRLAAKAMVRAHRKRSA